MKNDTQKNDGEQNAKLLMKHGKSLAKNPPLEIERLRAEAVSALDRLRQFSKKDTAALEALAGLLLHEVRAMNKDGAGNLEHYRQLTRRCASWPGIITADKDIQRTQELLIKQLQLGTAMPLNFSGRQWSRSTPEIRAALRLIDCLQRQRQDLPPLTRATAPQWWKASKDLFYSIHGKDFENHPNFSSYWKGHDEWKDSAHKQPVWIRKTILDKMRQAFVSIARKNQA